MPTPQRIWQWAQATLIVEDDEEDDGDAVTYITEQQSKWQQFWRFIGPGYLIAVGYMDPGNWATDIGGGARFGYTLLFVVLLSSIIAVMFQYLCIKLGVVTRLDLAQHCRYAFHPWLNLVLYVLMELAIMATDLAEVIGCAIALNLLFGLPPIYGVLITGLDVLIILRWWGKKTTKWYEMVVVLLVFMVAICFGMQLAFTKPDFGAVMRGFIPTAVVLQNPKMLFVAIAILGATGTFT